MKRTLLLFVTASAMLYGCSTDPEMSDVQVSATPTQIEETMSPPTFGQVKDYVADALGADVAAKMQPTSRYVRVFFESTEQMLTELAKHEIEYAPAPLIASDNEQVISQANGLKPMYALVNSDVSLPEGVKYEVIAEYFDPTSPLSGLAEDQRESVTQAMIEMVPTTRATTNWKPWGTISIYDYLADKYVPLSNVPIIITGYKANAGPTLITETCFTDSDGNFETVNTFSGFVGELITWKKDACSILSDGTNLANTSSCPMDRSKWNLMINTDSTDRTYEYASVYRAVNLMEENGYKISPCCDLFEVAISCLDEEVPQDEDDAFIPGNSSRIAPITIYCGRKSGLDLFKTTCREVGKAIQYFNIQYYTQNNYASYSPTMIESWGEFCKWNFVHNEYARLWALEELYDYTSEYGGYVPRPDNMNHQNWFYNTVLPADHIIHKRTPLFIDLVDDFNQHSWPESHHSGTMLFPQDNVEHASIQNIIEWSYSCKTISELKQHILTDAPLLNAQDVNTLFNVYLQLETAQNQLTTP